MQFLLNIHCNNAAFEGDENLGDQVSLILQDASERTRYGQREGVCRDANGNRVGEWRFTETDDALS